VDISEIDTLVFDSYTKPTIISSSEHYGEVNNLFVRCEFVSDYQNDDFFSSISNNIQGVSIEYINDTLCDGDTYNFYGTNINEPGVYFHTIANTSGGCDSLITLNLVTAEKFHDTINKVIYTGDTLDFNNTELTTEGTYIANLQTINGCDSIITLNLFTMARDTITLIQYDTIIDTLILFDTINTTDTLIVDNYIHDTTTIVDTLILFDTINTTDTLIVDNYIHDTTTIVDTLIINNYDTITLFDTLIIDNYDTIILYDTIIKTIYDTITNTIIDTLVQVVHDTIIPCPKILTYIFANISRGETYTDFGFSVSEEGTYIDTITSMDGCDSIIVLNLTISELNNNQTSQIKMFPNPTNDKIYLDLVNIPNATVIITDIKGQLAKQYNMPSNVNEAVLDIKNLSPGVYSVVVSNTQTRLTKKIIKR